ncbi:hypothetical protein [Hymenobacter ruber]
MPDYDDYTQADHEADTAGGRFCDATEALAYHCYACPLLDEPELLF